MDCWVLLYGKLLDIVINLCYFRNKTVVTGTSLSGLALTSTMLYFVSTGLQMGVQLEGWDLASGELKWQLTLMSNTKSYISPIISNDGDVYATLYGMDGPVYLIGVNKAKDTTLVIVSVVVVVSIIALLALFGLYKYKRSLVPVENRRKLN